MTPTSAAMAGTLAASKPSATKCRSATSRRAARVRSAFRAWSRSSGTAYRARKTFLGVTFGRGAYGPRHDPPGRHHRAARPRARRPGSHRAPDGAGRLPLDVAETWLGRARASRRDARAVRGGVRGGDVLRGGVVLQPGPAAAQGHHASPGSPTRSRGAAIPGQPVGDRQPGLGLPGRSRSPATSATRSAAGSASTG